ncbi:hypothetical protein MAP00_000761 [Monascus purpureus]|nr:hypothetical protein MAP00_000761 [Monascus purpureus]
MTLMDQITRIKNVMEREPFIIVLLDGDAVVFRDEFLQKGERGGRAAANQLWMALDDFVSNNFSGITSPKIVTKIFANVQGLGDLCVKAGVINERRVFEDFVRGFNNSKALFDLVDIGSEKGKASDKIEECFKLHLYNCHCHQILLGCSPDDGYDHILKNTLTDVDLTGRISLVEGIPSEHSMEAVRESYRVAKFPELFRTSKITTTPTWTAVATSNMKSFMTLSSSPNQYAASLSRSSTNTSPSGSNRTSSTPSLSDSQSSTEFQLVTSKSSKPSSPKTVERNKYGQRVDRLEYKNIPRDELNRIKKMKLCNYHYLLGSCPNTNCYHDHSQKLTKNELSILAAVARMTPCHFGLDCVDPDCIYGHRCPYNEPGKKDCHWGLTCRFDASAHGIDTNIVKVTKI